MELRYFASLTIKWCNNLWKSTIWFGFDDTISGRKANILIKSPVQQFALQFVMAALAILVVCMPLICHWSCVIRSVNGKFLWQLIQMRRRIESCSIPQDYNLHKMCNYFIKCDHLIDSKVTNSHHQRSKWPR